jgi:type IV pilus assembly protein PilA
MAKQKGFTLIELIVVITIIVVISTLAIISYGSVNKRARDGRRTSDLQKIAIALEMARQIGNTYPASSATLVSAGYLAAWPVDPKGYTYLYTVPTNYTYNLKAYMEDLGSTNIAPSGNCAAPGNCNYQITNP